VALALGFLFGFIGSIPVAGPIALLVFAYGIEGRRRDGVALSVGAAIAESGYAVLAFYGLARVLERSPGVIPYARGAGAVILLGLGVTFMLRGGGAERHARRGAKGAWASFLLGLTITALNPTLIVTWTGATTALFSTGWLAPSATLAGALPFGGGVALGVSGWFALLLWLLGRYRDRVKRATLDRVVRWLGGALAALGVWFAYRFVAYLAGRGG
jgi:threonine/homoserine/homoserine lactone efflux protein